MQGAHIGEKITPQHTHMAWTETRQGSCVYVACWKQDGKKIRKSTGVPVKGRDGMSARQAQKLAQEVADGMERLAKGQTTYLQAADALRSVAQASGMGGKMPTVREYLTEFQGQAGAKTESNRKRAFTRFMDYLGKRADMRAGAITNQRKSPR